MAVEVATAKASIARLTAMRKIYSNVITRFFRCSPQKRAPPNRRHPDSGRTDTNIRDNACQEKFGRRIIRKRVKSGMANAKAKGVRIGRPHATADDIPAVFLRHYPAFKNKQLNVSELARVCDLSRTTVYKYIGLLEQ